MFHEHKLPVNVKSWDELTDAAQIAHNGMVQTLYMSGVSKTDLGVISSNMSDMMKWFASEYSQLMMAGKIPEDKKYRADTNEQ